jgi:DNA mismatch endonuclease, patch repair protein
LVTPKVKKDGKKQYLRDGRAPIPESEATSRVMSANKGKDTSPELKLRMALRDAGVPGYRLHWKKAPGRPDIVYPRHKLAIFVHGDFWHRCPVCNLPLPKSNTDFWRQKLERNFQRDANKVAALESEGWTVVICWEHEVKSEPENCAMKIKSILEKSKASITDPPSSML